LLCQQQVSLAVILSSGMLRLLDIFLTILHLAVVLFNLFGWLPKATRKTHLVSIILTAASWFLLGIWFGTGYCPLTHWQWNVKAKLGERNLPENFIEYFAEKLTNHDFETELVSTLIVVCFSVATLLSVYVNFVLPKRKRKQGHG
jgi:hypothetical protein